MVWEIIRKVCGDKLIWRQELFFASEMINWLQRDLSYMVPDLGLQKEKTKSLFVPSSCVCESAVTYWLTELRVKNLY